MKGVASRCLWAFILAVGVLNVRPDVLLLWQTYIFRYDEHDGTLLSKTPRSLRPETVDSLAIGPDGDIYGLGNGLGWGSVVRFDGVTGAYKGFFISDNSGIHAPASIRFGPDGNLYLAAEGWSHSAEYMRLFRYDPKTGALKGEVIPQSAQVSSPGRMTFGPDSKLYVADRLRGIIRFDVSGETGQFIDTFSAPNTVTTNCTIEFGRNGFLYAVTWEASVFRINPQTGQIVDQLVDGPAVGIRPGGRWMPGPDGDIYIIDGGNVRRFDGANGTSKGIFITGDKPQYGEAYINSMIFFGPRLKVGRGPYGPRVEWPAALSSFQLQSRACVDAAWENVMETPAVEGAAVTVDLPAHASNRLFRLVKP